MATGILGGLYGLGFAEEQKRLAIWQKAKPIFGNDPNEWRMDDHGFIIRFSEYGNRNSPHGWEYDHMILSALGGSDNYANLRPLNWQVNCRRTPSGLGLLHEI